MNKIKTVKNWLASRILSMIGRQVRKPAYRELGEDIDWGITSATSPLLRNNADYDPNIIVEQLR